MPRKQLPVPLPTRVVIQYRLAFLLLLGAAVIGLLYSPSVSDDIRLSPLVDSCSINLCHDRCLDDGRKIDCFCNSEQCVCQEPTSLCNPALGQQCRVNAISGDAYCVTRTP